MNNLPRLVPAVANDSDTLSLAAARSEDTEDVERETPLHWFLTTAFDDAIHTASVMNTIEVIVLFCDNIICN